MPYLEYNGVNLFYEINGQGDRSLIFIHGLCGDHRVWSKNAPSFNNEYKVVCIDMFGHGKSSNEISPQAAFDTFPEVIESLIQKENLTNVVLVGHSIAGNLLSNCIEKDLKNISGYVFVDCAFNASQIVMDSRNKLADSLLNSSDDRLGSAVAEWYKTMMDMNQKTQDNELILSAQNNINLKWVLNFLKATNSIRKIPQTNLPVLIYESKWLTKDQPERSFYKVMPNASYCLWDSSNHFFFVYEAEKFNQQLKVFLDSHV